MSLPMDWWSSGDSFELKKILEDVHDAQAPPGLAGSNLKEGVRLNMACPPPWCEKEETSGPR